VQPECGADNYADNDEAEQTMPKANPKSLLLANALARAAAVSLVCLVCVAALGCGKASQDILLQGSGATFPAPLYKRWFVDYYAQHPAVRVNYSPIGSGAGIRQFTSGLVTFGASDAGMSKKEITKLPKEFGGVILMPMTAGAIVLSYNLPGLNAPIRLSRAAYVKIFLRRITSWDDPEIAKDNPGVTLPDQKITVVTRADSSGTTFAFTTHMDAVAKTLHLEWTPGVDKAVAWKESIAAQGNDGVAALVQLTPGAIGYIEYGYAELSGLPMAALENRSHEFLVPDREGKAGQRALEGATIPEDLQIRVTDPANAGAYPIVTYTWVLVRKHYDDPRQAETLRALLLDCLGDPQQEIAAQLGYLKLPADVIDRLRAELAPLTAKR
jgi:phosphate transport system substrate-binding protein